MVLGEYHCYDCHCSLTKPIFSGQWCFIQLKKAIKLSVKHRKAFNDFDKLFLMEVVGEWNVKVSTWDTNISKMNPYTEPVAGKYSCVIPCHQTC